MGEDHLLAANSLYNLTMVVSQIVGLDRVGSAIGRVGQHRWRPDPPPRWFLGAGAVLPRATVLVSRIPKDQPVSRQRARGASRWLIVWREAKEGWQFVSRQERVKLATGHMVMVNTLVMVLAMIAPGFAARVLGIGTQNAHHCLCPGCVGHVAGDWGGGSLGAEASPHEPGRLRTGGGRPVFCDLGRGMP